MKKKGFVSTVIMLALSVLLLASSIPPIAIADADVGVKAEFRDGPVDRAFTG